jgi:uncharacterized protein (TIGR03067 family)
MRSVVITVVMGSLLAVGCSSQGTDKGNQSTDKGTQTKQDKDAIQGEWGVVAAESRGKSMPAEEIARMSATFAGDKFTLWEGGGVNVAASFSLDPAKSPKQIDLKKEDGKSQLAIYELSGDELKLCVDESGKGRPSSFATSGAGNLMLVLKRKKL